MHKLTGFLKFLRKFPGGIRAGGFDFSSGGQARPMKNPKAPAKPVLLITYGGSADPPYLPEVTRSSFIRKPRATILGIRMNKVYAQANWIPEKEGA